MCCSLDSLVYFLTFYFYIKDAGRCRSGACICIMPHISHWFSILIGNNFSDRRGASRGLKKSIHAYMAARFPIGYKHKGWTKKKWTGFRGHNSRSKAARAKRSIQTIFYKDFDGLFRFEIAPFFEGENLIFVRPLFMLNALCPNEC